MSPRVLWLALALGGCGLSIVGTATESSDVGPADAGTGSADDARSAREDAAADAKAEPDADVVDGGLVVEGGCTLLVQDDFSAPDTRWVRQGDAVFTNNAALLVKAELQHHGAIVMKVPTATPITSFEASFDMIMVPDAGDPSPADGVALGWVANSDDPPPIGGSGGSLAFCADGNVPVGPRGAALALHVLDLGPGVYTLESDGGNCIGPNPTHFTFGNKEAVAVSVNGRDVDASVSGTPFSFKLASQVPIRWIGLYASTGGGVALFSVDNVNIKICP